ncbi:MAG: hypothetical protein IJP14_04840, partial [Clostridia bacterium]|nr:hypothetical protein [Clostridia bacterium]
MAKQFVRFSYNISIDRDDGPSDQSRKVLGSMLGVFVEGNEHREAWIAVHTLTASQSPVTVTVGDGMKAAYAQQGAFYALTDDMGRVLISNETEAQTATVGGTLYWITCRFREGAELTTDLSVAVIQHGKAVELWRAENATPANLHEQGFTLMDANRVDRVADLSHYIENNQLDAMTVGFADENGHIDNVVFRAAMMTAGAYGAKLVIPTATYYLTADADSPYGIDLSFIRPDGLHLDGQGSTVWITDNFKGGFSFIKCRDITVENLVLDYVNVPWAQGTVTAVDRETQSFTFELDDDYNIFDDGRFHETIGAHYGTVRNREEPRQLDPDALYYFFLKSCRKVADRVYEITLNEATPLIGWGMDP